MVARGEMEGKQGTTVPLPKRSLRVAQITPRFYPYVGGVERHVQQIGLGLAARGVQIDVYTTDPSGRLPRVDVIDGIVVRRFPAWAPNSAYFLSVALLRYLARCASDYDVIHAHNYHALPAILCLWMAREVPKVLTPHYHGSSASPFRNVLLRGYKTLSRMALPGASRIICVSEAEAQLLKGDFPGIESRTVVIPNGVDLEGLKAATPIPLQHPSVLCVGRLESYKNVDLIVRALAHLPDHALYLVGDGPHGEPLMRLAVQTGVEKRIHRFANVKDRQLYQFYRSADVVVNLSRFESFGMAVIEAIAAGAPLVLSDIPVFRPYGGTFGGIRLVSADATEREVAQAIGEMCRLGRCTRDLSELSWTEIATQILDVYMDVLGVCRDRQDVIEGSGLPAGWRSCDPKWG
jgi:glycosyltransferase involved in cell wall biosynthesis